MSRAEFLTLYAIVLATMLACRCLPLFALRNHQLPIGVKRALDLIPAAAFAALVANDLFDPGLVTDAPLQVLMTLAASAIVVIVAKRTGSLILCAVSGLVAYWLLVLVI